MSEQPFTTIGDEALEARIVAWVLGEASAFEIAEMERLCAERPELLIFQRRMKALHGLVSEAEIPRPDPAWKLPPAKRLGLLDVIDPSPALPDAFKETRVRRSAMRSILSIAACLIFTVIILGLTAPMAIRQRKKSNVAAERSMAMQREIAVLEEAEASDAPVAYNQKSLRTEIPAERIEGTPKPIILPKQTPTEERARQNESLAKKAKGALNSPFTDPQPPASQPVQESLAQEQKGASAPGKPSEPSSSMSKVIASSGTEIPVPAVDVTTPSVDFGDGKDFGRGWGNASGGAGGGFARTPGEISDTDSTRFAESPGTTNFFAEGKKSGENDDVAKFKADAVRDEESLKDSKSREYEYRGKDLSDNRRLDGLDRDPSITSNSDLSKNGAISGSVGPASRALEDSSELASRRKEGAGDKQKSEYWVADENAKAPVDGSIVNELDRFAAVEEKPSATTATNSGTLSLGANTYAGLDMLAEGRLTLGDGKKQSKNESSAEEAAGDAYWDTSGVAQSGQSAKPGASHEIHTGYTSEYLFRGVALGKEKESDKSTTTNSGVTVPEITTRSVLSTDEALAEAQKLRKSGRYDEARSTLEGALAHAPDNQEIDKELAYLDDPIRTNPALTYEHTKAVDQVRQNLYKAEGNYNLGKYDDAKREYEDVLRTDPHNSAARRGLEKLAQTKSDYYKAAYDHTRSELLTEVDTAWELEVPGDPKVTNEKHVAGVTGHDSPIAADDARAQLLADVDKAWEMNDRKEEAKSSSSLAQREMVRRQSSLAEAQRLLNDARSSYAAGDYQKAYETYEQSLNLIPDVPGNQALQERRNFLRKSLGDAAVALSVSAKKVGQHESARQWRDKARAWDPSNPQASEELAVEVSAEIPASEEPYSTFSLNISDTSFRIAQAALAKGERPDPAGIKVEQFYNAVNYGDPAPAAGQPVACLIEQSAHPVIPGRNLVRVALKTAAAGRSAAQPLRLTLLVDQSGSMSRADRRAAMDAAMRSLGTLLTDKDLVTVIGFSRKPRLLAVGMKGSEVAPQLAGLVNQASSEGGTNLEQAIKLAEEKALSHKLVGAQNRIVLFTDGAANLGDADPLRLAAKVEQLRQQGISFDIAGIAADDLNDELLAELARKGNGRYSVVGKGEEQDFAKQLAGAFRPAAENVKVQVRFNPERVARYKLIGFEKDRLKTEDFRNDAVDAAELAAEEAGVAIYQVEPIADGRGEIGEVSVRFRDTSSGEMVERMWTMTHNAASPAIDRAAPSMQLAVLATLAGEKLKGGPLADAIDFKQFADSQATVKQAFVQDARVADMLRMIDALK